jgi:DNA adenine methylase
MSKIKKLMDEGIINPVPQIIPQTNKSEKKEEFIFAPPKPILKWVGGKTQILDKIFERFPKEINNYHEIFLGGGSVLFALLYMVLNKQIKMNGKIFAYDLNPSLINMYKIIQSKPKKLIKVLNELIEYYNSIKTLNGKKNPENEDEALISKESFYYWIRKLYNTKYNKLDDTTKNRHKIRNAAMFIFLNKTGFRGLYRVGPNGFNVPFGNYKNPSIMEKEQILEISKLIKNVIFNNLSFTKSLIPPNMESSLLESGDFVYLDPPYAPENEKSFVSYTDDGFNIDKHKELFDMIKTLKQHNIKFMMSNADVELVRSNFPDYQIESIECKRSINSKNPGAKTFEVIIR